MLCLMHLQANKTRRLTWAAAFVACAGLFALAGCQERVVVLNDVCQGCYGEARGKLVPTLSQDVKDRSYTIDRMRLGISELADGLPDSAETTMNETYYLLRTQGLNADKTVEAVVVNEGVKRWKGEPFEQALMYCFIAVQKAMRGEWDNARAAASNSLFMLKDFSEQEEGEKKSRHMARARFAARLLGWNAPAGHQPPTFTRISSGDDAYVTVEERRSESFKVPNTTTDACLASAAFFQRLHEECNVELIGEDVIDDQEVWVIKATLRRAKRPEFPPNAVGKVGYRLAMMRVELATVPAGRSVTYYFSKEKGVLLQQVVASPNGQILSTVSFSNYQLNPELPEATFTYPGRADNEYSDDFTVTGLGNLLAPW